MPIAPLGPSGLFGPFPVIGYCPTSDDLSTNPSFDKPGILCIPESLGLDRTAIFGCCFDGSRCTVNHPEDKSTQKYQLVYNITYTKQVDNVKDMRTFVKVTKTLNRQIL